jgi:hypothetical protein
MDLESALRSFIDGHGLDILLLLENQCEGNASKVPIPQTELIEYEKAFLQAHQFLERFLTVSFTLSLPITRDHYRGRAQ